MDSYVYISVHYEHKEVTKGVEKSTIHNSQKETFASHFISLIVLLCVTQQFTLPFY